MRANTSYPLNHSQAWRYCLSTFYKTTAQDSYELSPSALWITNQSFLFAFLNDVDMNNISLELEQKQIIYNSKHIEIHIEYYMTCE